MADAHRQTDSWTRLLGVDGSCWSNLLAPSTCTEPRTICYTVSADQRPVSTAGNARTAYHKHCNPGVEADKTVDPAALPGIPAQRTLPPASRPSSLLWALVAGPQPGAGSPCSRLELPSTGLASSSASPGWRTLQLPLRLRRDPLRHCREPASCSAEPSCAAQACQRRWRWRRVWSTCSSCLDTLAR